MKRDPSQPGQPEGSESSRRERLQTASRRRRATEKQELRQAILKVAGELFLQHGYEQFSLRQVAEQIGYTPGAIYLYFRNKDDLLLAVVSDGFEHFQRSLQAAAESTNDAQQRLHALLEAYIHFGLENPVLYRLIFMQRTDFLMEHSEGLLQPKVNWFALLQEATREALAAHALPQGEEQSTADVLWSCLHGLVSLAISLPFFDEHRVRATVIRLHDLLCQIQPSGSLAQPNVTRLAC